MLTATFVSAIFGFGKIDAIGHAPIIGVLLVIVADSAKEQVKVKRLVYLPAAIRNGAGVLHRPLLRRPPAGLWLKPKGF